MAKELFISSSPHETKVAVLEDDQLVEVYFERETDAGVVGGIYKGRVSRVLPGMQSAFVNIGLERDAFLYVSDFFLEDSEDFDKIFDDAESRVIQASTTNVSTPAVAPTEVLPVKAASEPVVVVDVAHRPAAPGPEITDAAVPEIPPLPPAVEVAVVTPPSEGGGLPSSRPTAAPPAPPERRSDKPDFRRYEPRGRRRKRRGGRNFGERPFTDHRPFRPEAEPHSFEVLPGESLAKYRHKSLEAPRVETSISGTSEAPISESPEVPEAAREFSPISEVPEGFFPEPGPSETFGRGLKEGEAPAAPTNLVVGSDSGPREGTTGSSEISQTATGGREVPAAPVSAVEPLMEVQERILPFHPAEAIPSATAKARDVRVPAFSELPSTAKEESAQITPEVSVESAEEVEGSMQGEEEDTEPESMSDDEIEAQGDAGDESISGEPEAFGEDLVEDTQEQVEAPDEPGVLTQPPAQPTGDSAERTYTLREPHQRPHYAPRRVRRGRRGMGGRRPVRRESPRPGNNQPVQIAEILKEGQEILVQIAKEPLGTKGARITSHIALPGRYLVYMPTINHIGVSRKITSEEERLRLRNIILENRGSLTGGFIVRTAGGGRSEEEFKADLKFLMTLWNDIRTRSEKAKAPALIHRDLDLVQRLLRDILTPDFKQVRVDNEVEYERVLDFVSRCQPTLVGHVKLYTRDTPLFDEFGVQAEIEKALKPKVWLKSGGYIVINQTEALVAIDVNTGKYVGKTNRLEDTILKTNIDAVNEIVRQVRLRDLGGIIVIDFIDMDERKNRAKVVQALEEALRKDRAPTKVISFHDFGLVAVTRKRVKQSLERTLSEHCSYCSGSGWIKSPTTICYEILAEVKKMAKHIEGDSLTVRVNPEVAKSLKSQEGKLISEIESLTRRDVVIKSDPAVHQERFEIY